MQLTKIERIDDTNAVNVTYYFSFNRKNESVRVVIPTGVIAVDTDSVNPFLTFALLPAMLLGEDIDLGGGSVSRKLIEHIPLIQSRYLEWFTELNLKQISVVNMKLSDTICASRKKETYAFFTGGVDSFDTVINTEATEGEKKIDHLLYVYGFDVRLGDSSLYSAVMQHIDEAAKELGKSIIHLSTDLREFTERYVGWDYIHGAALIALAQLCTPSIETLYIAASNSTGQLTPNGSHPDLDPLFATEGFTLIHYGVERKRIEKIMKNIVNSQTALDHLRVCWKNGGGSINCGVCEKCIRTMLALEAAGVLDRAKTFHRHIDADLLERITIPNEGIANLYRELLPYLLGTPLHDRIRDFVTLALAVFDKRVSESLDAHGYFTKSNGFKQKQKNILFIDFNGVISYHPFWASLREPNHALHRYNDTIERFLFKENTPIVLDWMIGKYRSEEIHDLLEEKLGVPSEALFAVFEADCRSIDISERILNEVRRLREFYRTILITDNMDSFERFTLPENPRLLSVFDQVDNSYVMKRFKKSDEGVYFTERVKEAGASIADSILLDDSKNNCGMFVSLGGVAHMTKTEDEAVDVLQQIRATIEKKWEWQY